MSKCVDPTYLEFERYYTEIVDEVVKARNRQDERAMFGDESDPDVEEPTEYKKAKAILFEQMLEFENAKSEDRKPVINPTQNEAAISTLLQQGPGDESFQRRAREVVAIFREAVPHYCPDWPTISPVCRT